MKGAIQVSWARQSKYRREMFKQVKEKQKQPLVGVCSSCLLLLYIKFFLPYFLKLFNFFFSIELGCDGWDLGLSNFQNPVTSVIKLNLLSPFEDS